MNSNMAVTVWARAGSQHKMASSRGPGHGRLRTVQCPRPTVRRVRWEEKRTKGIWREERERE